MGKFVNGLLGDAPSVNKMAEAMQVAPRSHPRDIIDQAIGQSEMADPQQMPPQQPPQQAPQQMPEAPPDVVQQQLPPPQEQVLSDDPGADVAEDNSGTAALREPTADEEKQARILMANVVDFLYGEGLQTVSKSLKSGQEVPQTIGEIAAELVTTQMDAAEAANQTVSPDIIMSVGAEVVGQIYELAEALGVWQPGTEEQASKDMNTSLSYATNLFVQTQQKTGRQDRIAGMQQVVQDASAGKYDSQPGSQFTDDMAPVPEGGLL